MICINEQQKDDELNDRVQKAKKWKDFGEIYGLEKEFESLMQKCIQKEKEINGEESIENIHDLDDLEKRDWTRRTKKQESKPLEETDELITGESQQKKIIEGEMIRKRIKLSENQPPSSSE